jgi:hypothetical protein
MGIGKPGIINCLWLRNIHNTTTNTPNIDNGAPYPSFHEMLRNSDASEILTVYIDAPEPIERWFRVGDGRDILAVAGAGDEIVDFAVVVNDFCYSGVDGRRRRDICVVSGDFGRAG